MLQTPKATSDDAFFTLWVQKHMEISKAMGKPLILEELGKRVTANLTEATLQVKAACVWLDVLTIILEMPIFLDSIHCHAW